MSTEFYQEYIENNKAIIYKICRAYAQDNEELQDYFQEVSLQLWKAKDSFNNKSKLSTWVYRVTLNVCLTLVRTKKSRPQKAELSDQHLENRHEPEDPELEQLELLYGAIRKLKEVDRALILLYLEKKSYEEMSEITGMNINHIGVKINRIKNQLKKLING